MALNYGPRICTTVISDVETNSPVRIPTLLEAWLWPAGQATEMTVELLDLRDRARAPTHLTISLADDGSGLASAHSWNNLITYLNAKEGDELTFFATVPFTPRTCVVHAVDNYFEEENYNREDEMAGSILGELDDEENVASDFDYPSSPDDSDDDEEDED